MDETIGWTRREKLGLAGLVAVLVGTFYLVGAGVIPKVDRGPICDGRRIFSYDIGYAEFREEFRQEGGPCEMACPNAIWEPFKTQFSSPTLITGETAEPGLFMRRQCASGDYEFRPLTPAETDKMERAARWWEN